MNLSKIDIISKVLLAATCCSRRLKSQTCRGWIFEAQWRVVSSVRQIGTGEISLKRRVRKSIFGMRGVIKRDVSPGCGS